MSQVTLDTVQQFGSNFTIQGRYPVSFIEGKWFCPCDFMAHPHPKEDQYCRHILKERLKQADERIKFLEQQIRDFEEGWRKHRKRGMGASYNIKKPNITHRAIMNLLSEYRDGRPKRWIRHMLRERNVLIEDDPLGGRISELLGNGYLEMSENHKVICALVDGTMTFRFDEDGRELPLYFLTAKGWNFVSNLDVHTQTNPPD